MAITKENTLQSFEWFKNLLQQKIQNQIATIQGGEENVIEFVAVDGTIIRPDANKTVNLNLSGYAKKSDLAGAISSIHSLSTIIGGLSNYTLPTASGTIKGGVKVGDWLKMTGTNKEVLEVDKDAIIGTIVDAIELAGSSVNHFSDTDKQKLDSIEYGAQKNVIETVKVNNSALPVSNKAVNIDLSAYAKKTDVTSGVRFKGSVDSFSDLPTSASTGDLYNIRNAGGSDGEGVAIEAGDNVVFTDGGKWDVMAGLLDLSDYAKKSDIAGALSSINSLSTIISSLSSGEDNIIEAISIDGNIQPVTSKTAALNLSDYAKKADLIGAISSIHSLSTAINGLSNYTLPAATVTRLGGIKVGEGLTMDANDVLNVTLEAGIGDVFIGATEKLGGESGIVPAPAKGKQKSFLRGDGTWADLVFSIGGTSVTLGSDVAATQGGLWQDYFTDAAGYKTPCLKLRYGDYEYNFNYDTSERVGTAAPTLIDNVGIQYTLSLIPSTQEGGLWYEVTDGTPTLFMHKYAYNYGYNYDTITYKGDSNALYSYMPFDRTTADAMEATLYKAWTATGSPVVATTSLGHKGLKNTGKLTTQLAKDLSSTTVATWTIDFWLYVENSNNLPKDGKFYRVIYFAGKSKGSTSTAKGTIAIYNGSLVIREWRTSSQVETTVATVPLENRRMHIAITRNDTKPRVFVDGKFIIQAGNFSQVSNNYPMTSLYSVELLGDTSSTLSMYIDHFRIFSGQSLWDEDFEVPQPEDYLK